MVNKMLNNGDLRKITIPLNEVETFRKQVDSGLINTDSSDYFKYLEEGDFTDIFAEMLADR